MKPKANQLQRLIAFALERHRVWYRRFVLKTEKPWTQDKILQTYRFCNVFRELDTVTQWIDTNIRKPYAKHPHLWLMLCAARQINWPDTLEDLMRTDGAFFNSDWSPERMRSTMLARRKRGEKVYTGAYMISGQRSNPDRTKADKPHITANLTLLPMWKERHRLTALFEDAVSLEETYATLSLYNGFGSFMTAQVIADMKHTRYLKDASDWWTWCALGPGSTRGLNRVYGRRRDPNEPHKGRFKPLNMKWSAEETSAAIEPLRNALIDAFLKTRHAPFLPVKPICAQDTQNCLCEFDKYERVRLGEGRPRALYDGAEET